MTVSKVCKRERFVADDMKRRRTVSIREEIMIFSYFLDPLHPVEQRGICIGEFPSNPQSTSFPPIH